MSSRRAKKFKNWLLPLTFILGIACFPLGSMLMGQAKKVHHALTKPHHSNQKTQKAHKSMSKHKKIGKSKHKKTAAHHSAKSHKKVARAH